MKNKSISIPAGMVFKKFYCHKCSERLVKEPKKRIVKPGDIDYREHNKIGRMHMVGEVEVTEYDFKCIECGNIISYDEQCVIGKIQKKLNKKELNEQEIEENREEIKNKLDKNAKIYKFILGLITAIIVVVVVYFEIKNGEFSFELFF